MMNGYVRRRGLRELLMRKGRKRGRS